MLLPQQRCYDNIYSLFGFANYFLYRKLFQDERIRKAKQDFLQEKAEVFFKVADFKIKFEN